MVKRCIGINIGPSYIRAVQIARKADQFCIEKTFSTQTRRSTDSRADIIRSLIDEQGFDQHAEVAVSMPHDAVFFRDIEADQAGLETILEQNISSLEYNFPIETDEMITQIYSYKQISDKKYSVLVAAASKETLRQTLQLLDSARMQPKLVEAAAFALYATVAINHPEITTSTAVLAHIDESYLTLVIARDNEISIVRNIPIPSRNDEDTNSIHDQVAQLFVYEVRNTWRKAFACELNKDCDIYLTAPEDILDNIYALALENLYTRIVTIDPYANVQCSTDSKATSAISIAEGLALRSLAPEQTKGTNFLEADRANTESAFNLKRELAICSMLAVAIIFVWLTGLFTRLSYLEKDYAAIKTEMNNVFLQTLPEEENIVNPLVQLQNKLDSFRKDHGLFASFNSSNLRPLQILHSISTNIPSDTNIKVDDLLITSDSVRITGSCDSFESMHQCQRLLQKMPSLALVDVPDIQREPKTGRIHFTILLTSKNTEHK
jgi:Tfp pilus assembly PilM family ATPase